MLFWNAFNVVVGVILIKDVNSKEFNKNNVVEDIIKKISYISSDVLAKAPPDKRDEILNKIERKVKLYAKQFGQDGFVYTQFIMQGLNLSQNGSEALPLHSQVDYIRLNQNERNRQEVLRSKTSYNKVSTLERQSHEEVVNQNMYENGFNISKNYVDETKTYDERQEPLININNNIKETNHNNYETMTTDLISHRRNINDNILQHSENKRHNNLYHKVDQPVPYASNVEEEMSLEMTTPDTFYYGVTTLASCETTVDDICTDVKSLTQFVCTPTGKVLSLRKVCDGVVDCATGVDEEKCLEKAKSRMHWAVRIMSTLESYLLGNCFASNDKRLLIKQNAMLSDILRKQTKFLEKYTSSGNHENDKHKMNRSINELVLVIKALAIALNSLLCSQHLRNANEIDSIARSQISLTDNDTASYGTKMQLSACSCAGSFCGNVSCSESCKKFCWFKYNLDKFGCQAADESTSVPLDVLCDDKLDCYDETDEISCNTGVSLNKFEANQIYDNVLKMLRAKAISKEYSFVQTEVLGLYDKVKRLQKITLRIKADDLTIKNIRDDCFSTLVLIYEDLAKNVAANDLHEAELFLINVNENLAAALKLSHTGNTKIASRTGCVCRESRCISYKCSNDCQRACSIRPMLARYWCKGTLKNVSIPIEWICNKRIDCPYEDDEAQCNRDDCGKHHLVSLRQSLRDVGEKDSGTVLGEALKTWRSKVTEILTSAERNYRPTPTMFREIVSDVLHDLALAYGSIETTNSRRHNNHVMKEFMNVSKQVMQSLRSCSE